MNDTKIPTLYEWAGGTVAIEAWIHEFYSRVREGWGEVGGPYDPDV